MRQERQLDNDRWQSMLFRDQSGAFTGSYEVYQPLEREGRMGLQLLETGSVELRLETTEKKPLGLRVDFQERYTPSSSTANFEFLRLLQRPTVEALMPPDLRISQGHQIIGSAFTLVSSSPGAHVAELCVRDGPIRLRVKYCFLTDAAPGVWTLAAILIAKEAQIGSAPLQIKPLFAPALGGPLYDAQFSSGPEYTSINMPGRLTLCFPRTLREGDFHVLSMQWEATKMMYQLDRKFDAVHSGAIKTFELTEITPDDAEAFPANPVVR